MTGDEQKSIGDVLGKWKEAEERARRRSRLTQRFKVCLMPVRVALEINPITDWVRRLGGPDSPRSIEEQAAMWFAILRRPQGLGRYTNSISRWMARSPRHAQFIRGMFEHEASFADQIGREAVRWYELFDRRLDRPRHRRAFCRWCRLSRVHVAAFLDVSILCEELDLIGRAGLMDSEALLKR